MKILFNFLIFPGFLFSACAGLMAVWFDRKVTARLQWRKGPPWHQSFTDIIKLLGKETIVPQGSRWLFLFAPYFGLLGLVLVSTILGMAIISGNNSFSADVIVVIYLLTIPAISLIMGASSSRNPLASVGASREMKLLLAYELPFLIALSAVLIRSSGSIRLGEIIGHQALAKSNIISWSGSIAFVVSFFCMMGKLGTGPFDIAEADQELMGGTLIEYSGFPLALFKINKAMVLYTVSLFLIVLFMGRDLSIGFLLLKFLGIVLLFILVKNTNPRLRIDQAMRFFWGPVTVLALIALGLALAGK